MPHITRTVAAVAVACLLALSPAVAWADDEGFTPPPVAEDHPWAGAEQPVCGDLFPCPTPEPVEDWAMPADEDLPPLLELDNGYPAEPINPGPVPEQVVGTSPDAPVLDDIMTDAAPLDPAGQVGDQAWTVETQAPQPKRAHHTRPNLPHTGN